jgi:hypothetical protein
MGAMHQLDQKLKSKQWNVQFEALNVTRALALHHADVLAPRLHAVTAAVVLAADSLRSSVAKNGLMTLNDMCTGLQQMLTKETGVVVTVLIKRSADTSNKFVSQAATDALNACVTYCPGSELLKTLISSSSSKNAGKREEAARSMSTYIKTHGCHSMEERELNDVIKCGARFTTDGKQGTRHAGRELVWTLNTQGFIPAQALKRMSSSEQAAIAKVVNKGAAPIENSNSIGSPMSARSGVGSPPRRASPAKRSSARGSRNSTSRDRGPSNNKPNRRPASDRDSRVATNSSTRNNQGNRSGGGVNVNVRAAAGNGAARKPTRAVPVSRERAKQRREEAERSERQRRAQEEEDRTRQVEHKRKTAEMAERGRARAYERLQQQKEAVEIERRRQQDEDSQQQQIERERRSRQEAANQEHRKRTQRRLAQYKAKQKQEVDAEKSRQARLEEAEARIKAERAKQAKAKADEERRRIRAGVQSKRTKTKLVERKSAGNRGQGGARKPQQRAPAQHRPPPRNDGPAPQRVVGYGDGADDDEGDWEGDAMQQVRRSQNERQRAQDARSHASRGDRNIKSFDKTTKAVKNYAWQDDGGDIFADPNSGFDEDLNNILEFHPPMPKGDSSALNKELSALGLDGLQDDQFFAKQKAAPKRRGNERAGSGGKRRPQRKLMQLNEVGSYEYGAHGALVPEGTVQETPLSPLSRFIKHSDSQEFKAYQQSQAVADDYPNMSPAPITRYRRGNQQQPHRGGGGRNSELNRVTAAEQKIMQELAGLDQKLEVNRRKNLKSTHSEPARRSRPRMVQRSVPVATASMGKRPQGGMYGGVGFGGAPSSQMMTQSPGGKWYQGQFSQHPPQQQQQYPYHRKGAPAPYNPPKAGVQNPTASAMANNMYGYVPSYGNGPTAPVFHEGVAYYYPPQQQQQPPGIGGGGVPYPQFGGNNNPNGQSFFGQAASRNLAQPKQQFSSARTNQVYLGNQPGGGMGGGQY